MSLNFGESYHAFGFGWNIEPGWDCIELRAILDAVARGEDVDNIVVSRSRHSTHRSVFLTELQCGERCRRLFLKRRTGPRFRFSKSVLYPHKEYRGIQAARGAGIIVPEAVALGQQKGFFGKVRAAAIVLADLALPTLDQHLARTPKASRLGCICAAAAFMASFHEQGFIHGNMHPTNIVVASEQPLAFGLLDMDRFRKVDMSVNDRIAELARLTHFLSWILKGQDFAEIVQAYMAASPSLDTAPDKIRERFERAMMIRGRLMAFHEYGHCIEKRKHLNVIPGGLLKSYVGDSWIADLADNPPETPQRWIEELSLQAGSLGGKIDVRTNTSRRSLLPCAESAVLGYWRVANYLHMLQIPSPEPVCYIGLRGFASETAVMFLPCVPVPFLDALTDSASSEAVVQKAGGAVGALHGSGALHGRLEADALLVTQEADGLSVLLDGFERAVIGRRVTGTRAKSDIASLVDDIEVHGGYTLRDRFLDAYKTARSRWADMPLIRRPNRRRCLL